ncbi:MAG: patatin [Solirubrobacterales bacterium]|nr:patatin [Solirubrobacterales bacterium]
MSSAADSPNDRFRILCIDGGGIRGLIPALVIAELESRLQDRVGAEARISDYFHLLAGTSTGGLIALALTAPGREVTADRLSDLYTEDGPTIFHRTPFQRVATLGGLIAPKYGASALRAVVEEVFGDAKLSEALRDLVVTSYDMTNRDPYFFKRWRALESEHRDHSLVDAALATSAAPTYFPPHEVDGRALVDGGVFAANPVIAAIAESLKRSTDKPAQLTRDDLLVVSVGTGLYEEGFSQSQVRRWGKLGWIMPHGEDPPVLGAVLGGASDGADHWAHMLLNHPRGAGPPSPTEIGRGPRFFRLQVQLPASIAMDDAGPETLQKRLPDAATELLRAHDKELSEIIERLARFDPLP